MLDKRYKPVEMDLVLEKMNNSLMRFSLSDNQTSDFYISITRNNGKIDLSDYKVVLYIKNPNDVILKKELTKYDTETNLFYCNLENKYKNINGEYICQIIIEDVLTTEKLVPLSEFRYEVKNDIISEEVGTDTPDVPSGNINIEYDEDTGIILFDCDVEYDKDSGIALFGFNSSYDEINKIINMEEVE